MEIKRFRVDIPTGFVFADFSVGNANHSALVWTQAGQPYVSTGSRIRGDLERHSFSPFEIAAYRRFLESGDAVMEIGGSLL